MECHGISQKFPFPGSINRTLGMIDTKIELRLKEPGYARQNTLAADSAADINVAIVGITAEAVPASFQLLVEIIQKDIRQERT